MAYKDYHVMTDEELAHEAIRLEDKLTQVQKLVSALILKTPTGPIRNELTNINILLLEQ